MSTPPVFVRVARKRQVFTFLMNGSDTVADVLTKIHDVAKQHDVPQASDDARLILDDAPVEMNATISSLSPKPEGLSLQLVFAINDDEYEPVEVDPTTPS